MIGALWLMLLACPKPSAESPSGRAVSAACPTFVSDVHASSCDGLPGGYGTTKEMPLEWGLAARGNDSSLYYGRLVCPNGAVASARRTGNAGAPPQPSGSPLVGDGEWSGNDVLDSWAVTCPGMPAVTLYTNTYRCGSPCAPRPFDLLPAAATRALERSRLALEAKDVEGALAGAREAAAAEPESEIVQAWLGMVLLESGRPVPAVDAFAAASSMNPFDPYHRLHEAFAWQALNEPDKAEQVIDELRGSLAPDHALVPDVTCMKAWAIRVRGDEPGGRPLAEAACARGVSACCPERWDRP